MKGQRARRILKRIAFEDGSGEQVSGALLSLGRSVYGNPKFKAYTERVTGQGVSQLDTNEKRKLLRDFLSGAA